MTQKPPLAISPSSDVSIAASLEGTSLSLKARSRAVSALDRLLGSISDLPAAWLEGFAERARARNEIKKKIILATGTAALEKLAPREELGDHIADAVVAKSARRQLNIEAVVHQTCDLLTRTSETASGKDDVANDDAAPEKLDEDWLNTFEQYAENASSERVRNLWARVLSGKIRQPAAFSLSTLRFLSEADTETAQLFGEIVKDRIGEDTILKPERLDGDNLINYLSIETKGLIIGAGGFLHLTFSGTTNREFGSIFREIAIFGVFSNTSSITVPVVKLSRVGQEIAAIMAPLDPRPALRKLADFLGPHCDTISIGRVTKILPDGGFEAIDVEKLK